MKKGDKLVCVKSVNNVINKPLFIKGSTYEILGVYYGGEIILNHILYGNEYGEFSPDFVKEHFKTLKEVRKEKLNEIDKGRK